MKNLITLLILILSFQGFSQTKYILSNKLNCDFKFALQIVESDSCVFVESINITIPATSNTSYIAPLGAEVKNVKIGFVDDLTCSISLSSPDTTSCPNCPNVFPTEISYTCSCNIACCGTTIYYIWKKDCVSPDEIMVHD